MLNHPHYWYFCIFEFKYLSENWSIISINAFQRFATEFLTSLNNSGSLEVQSAQYSLKSDGLHGFCCQDYLGK